VRAGSKDSTYGEFNSWGDYLIFNLGTHLEFIKNYALLPKGLLEEASRLFDDLDVLPEPVAGSILHGDPGPHNLVVQDFHRVTLIDWEDAMVGDPLFELAHWATFRKLEEWPPFFEAYFQGEWKLNQAFWTYFARISIAKQVARFRLGISSAGFDPRGSARISIALKGLRGEL
jgi:hypothetical protein